MIRNQHRTGRIKSQKKESRVVESQLLKQYDTTEKFYDIKYDRVTQLKNKYAVKQNCGDGATVSRKMLYWDHFKDPHHAVITSKALQTQNSINRGEGAVTEGGQGIHKTRGVSQGQAVRNHNMGISNRSASQMKSQHLQSDNQMQMYRIKAEQINSGISCKLDHLQDQINRLKDCYHRKHYQQEQQRSRRQQILMTQARIQQEILKRQQYLQAQIQQVPTAPTNAYPQITIQQLSNPNNHLSSIIVNNSHLYNPTQNLHLAEQSSIELQGLLKKDRNYTKQFMKLISRLKDQIYFDYQFTQTLLSISPEDLQVVSSYIKQHHSQVDLSFFEISPNEMDPMYIPMPPRETDVERTGQVFYEFYQQMQSNYTTKLHRKFQKQTIDTLFLEIGEEQPSIGHIVSYINMRTGMEFRNRALVKLLRRMGIYSHIIPKFNFYNSLSE